MHKPIWLDSTPEQKTILITLLMMANHQGREWEWQGKSFKAQPGQFVTSLESITHKSGKGITIQNVRTALKRLEKFEFLTNESTNRNRLITIVNWGLYQGSEDEPNKQLTSNQQAPNKQLTTNKNVKNEKNINIYADVINYLNEKAGTNFKDTTKKTRDLIKARVNENFTKEDLILVIDYCCTNWKGKTFANGNKGDDYLQPSTLFNNKFDERLQKAKKTKGSTKETFLESPELLF
ncbi:conserved phage C-terminal domain-containing protein [Metabacillus sp. 84]|uniref:conserved phage C-terminal domain-containing protein n=1 Tax=Metabacillus sp. 84 TaxID=3404705 RepID=UPI003CF34B2B